MTSNLIETIEVITEARNIEIQPSIVWESRILDITFWSKQIFSIQFFYNVRYIVCLMFSVLPLGKFIVLSIQ